MRALTVQQPWAWAIVHGGKDVENRTQLWSHRGELAIHAGMRVSERGLDSWLLQEAWRRAGEPPIVTSEVGAIIGLVDLVDAHLAVECVDEHGVMCSPWAESSYDEHGGKTRRDIVHLVLENPRPLATPVPCRGALGLWAVPPGVDHQVWAEL